MDKLVGICLDNVRESIIHGIIAVGTEYLYYSSSSSYSLWL